jgi:hypothetical protein
VVDVVDELTRMASRSSSAYPLEPLLESESPTAVPSPNSTTAVPSPNPMSSSPSHNESNEGNGTTYDQEFRTVEDVRADVASNGDNLSNPPVNNGRQLYHLSSRTIQSLFCWGRWGVLLMS